MKFFWKYIIVKTFLKISLIHILFIPENMQKRQRVFFLYLTIRYFNFNQQDSTEKLFLNFISDFSINT